MVEVGSSRAGNDTVKVIREHLRGLHALGTTGRAANVVRVFGCLIVELVDDFFACNNSRVTSAPDPVDDDLVVVCEPRAVERRTVVTGVVTDGSKTAARDVVHVHVVHASVDTSVVSVHGASIPLAILRKPDFHVRL